MAFGQNYKPMDVYPDAEAGTYEVEIISLEEKNVKGFNCLEAKFIYADGIKRSPSTFRIFDTTQHATESQQKAFNVKVSAFKKCFHYVGDFDMASLLNARGLRGMVKIGKDEKGYNSVLKFIIPQEDTAF